MEDPSLKYSSFNTYQSTHLESKDVSFINSEITKESLAISSTTTRKEFIKENWDISWNYNEFNKYPPIVKTTDFKVLNYQCYFIVNNKESSTQVTLPNPSDWPSEWGRKEIIMRNIQNQEVLSVDNDIHQLDGQISNKILPSISGKYVRLVSNGKQWVIKSIF